MTGWVKLHRSVFKHWLGTSPDALTLFLYCITRANYEPNKVYFRGEVVEVDRGQFITSTAKISEQFQWSRKKTERLLKLLKKEEQIELKRSNRKTVITVRNYDAYQAKDEDEGTAKGVATGATEGAATGLQPHTEKKDKKLKKDKETKKEKPLVFPPALDNDRCRKAWDFWLAYKKQIKKPYKTQVGQQMQLSRWKGQTADAFCEAIKYSIANEYQGIYEEKKETFRRETSRAQPKEWTPPWKTEQRETGT